MTAAATWALPGARRFSAALGTHLVRGYSVNLVVPNYLAADDEWCEHLFRSIDLHLDVVRAPDGADSPPELSIAETFDVERPQAGAAAASTLAAHDVLAGRTIAAVLRHSSSHDQWASFLQRFVAAGRPIAHAERPTMLVVSGAAFNSLLGHEEPLLTSRWWWGVHDRLDTAVFLGDSVPPQRFAHLVRDSIVEVAGFDLRLAQFLAERWDGAAESVCDLLESYSVYGDDSGAVSIPFAHGVRLDPPPEMVPLWNRGLVDAWDRFESYPHACALMRAGRHDEVLRRIWRAQIRALMPIIDEERERIAAWLRPELPRNASLPEVPELVDMIQAIEAHWRLTKWRGGGRLRLVRWLRGARNSLAHMRTLNPTDVVKGFRLIDEDRSRGN